MKSFIFFLFLSLNNYSQPLDIDKEHVCTVRVSNKYGILVDKTFELDFNLPEKFQTSKDQSFYIKIEKRRHWKFKTDYHELSLSHDDDLTNNKFTFNTKVNIKDKIFGAEFTGYIFNRHKRFNSKWYKTYFKVFCAKKSLVERSQF